MKWKFWKSKPHVHYGKWWDGFFEHCSCGACAGDLRDADGMRHIFFRDWPEEIRRLRSVK